jgi:hypothetical protein
LHSFCAAPAGAVAKAGGGVTAAVVTGAGTLTGAGEDIAGEVVAACSAASLAGCGLEDIMNAATVATVTTAPRPPISFAPIPEPDLRVCV